MSATPTSVPIAIEHYNEKGYAIIPGFYSGKEVAELAAAADQLKEEGLSYERSFRHKNLLFVLQDDPVLKKVLRFCHWPSYTYPVFAKYRNDERLLELLKPLLGENIKQISNQVVWKTPGAKKTSYGFHQDARFRRPAEAYRNMAK